MVRGEVSKRTSWRGHAAVYSKTEREFVAQLPVNEQFVLHQLKAYFGGEIHPDETSRSPKPETTPVYIDAEDIPFGEDCPHYPPKPGCDCRHCSGKCLCHKSPVRRPKPLYALQWSRGRGSVHKTKKQATRRMRAWKNWKVRQGWKVINHPTGFFAGKDGLREAVLIREIRKAPEGASLF